MTPSYKTLQEILRAQMTQFLRKFETSRLRFFVMQIVSSRDDRAAQAIFLHGSKEAQNELAEERPEQWSHFLKIVSSTC